MNAVNALEIRTVDYHTAGEPFRIVLDGLPPIAGTSVGDRRVTAQGSEDLNRVRAFLCQEPRGHADMYGGFLVPADDDGADLGVLFWHKDGFSTACGHGTIALASWAVESGRIEAPTTGEVEVVIDVPSGRVSTSVELRDGKVTGAVFRNVPSRVLARQIDLMTSRGKATVDLSYSGATYASVAAASLGLAVSKQNYTDLIAIGREIKWALNDSPLAVHEDDRLSGVYGAIIFEEIEAAAPSGVRQRSVTVFADGQVDRSPCGSGTGARIALLADDGTLLPGAVLTHESIVGTVFEGWWHPGSGDGVIPYVRGSAFRTGEHRFVLDSADRLGTGFTLR